MTTARSGGSHGPPTAPNRMREHRRKTGLSLRQLAAITGLGLSTCWRAEVGDASTIREATRVLIAAALRADPDDVFPSAGREDAPTGGRP